MLQLGKVQLLGEEMMQLGVDICGLSEVRCDGQGHFTTLDGHTTVYSGRLTQGMSGMAVWIHRKIATALMGCEPISDRVLVVRLKAKPRNISLIQVYGPTTAATDEEMESLPRLVSSNQTSPQGGHAACNGRHQRQSRQKRTNHLQCHPRLGCMAYEKQMKPVSS